MIEDDIQDLKERVEQLEQENAELKIGRPDERFGCGAPPGTPVGNGAMSIDQIKDLVESVAKKETKHRWEDVLRELKSR